MSTYIRGILSLKIIDSQTNEIIDQYGPSQNMVVDVGIETMWKRLIEEDVTNQYQLDSIFLGDDKGVGPSWSLFNPEPAGRTFTSATQGNPIRLTSSSYTTPLEDVMKVSSTIIGQTFMDDNFPAQVEYNFTSMTLRFKNGETFSYKRFPIRSITRFTNIKVDWRFKIENFEDFCYPDELPELTFTVENTNSGIEYFTVTPKSSDIIIDYGDGTTSTHSETVVVKGKDYTDGETKHDIKITSPYGFYVESVELPEGNTHDTVYGFKIIRDLSYKIVSSGVFSKFPNIREMPVDDIKISGANITTGLFESSSITGEGIDIPRIVIEDNPSTVSKMFNNLTITGGGVFTGLTGTSLTNGVGLFENAKFSTGNVILPSMIVADRLCMSSNINSTDILDMSFGSIDSFISGFENCLSLGPVLIFSEKTTKVASRLFAGCTGIEFVNNVNLPDATTTDELFISNSNLKIVQLLNLPSSTITSKLFKDCLMLEVVVTMNTGDISDASYMFSGCSSLKRIPNIKFSSSASATGMFDGCSSLEHIGGLENIDTDIDLSQTACNIDSLNNIANSIGITTGSNITLTGIPATGDPSFANVVSTIEGKGWNVIQ